MNPNLDGLFGPSPEMIGRQQYEMMRARAAQEAQMSDIERANYGMRTAGATLGHIGAGMLGGGNPAIEEAKRQEQVMSQGGDLTTSQGLKAKALQFAQAGDQRTAMKLVIAAREMEAKEQQMLIERQKQALAERKQTDIETEKRELDREKLRQAFEISKMRSEDYRLAAADRAAAAREANQIRLEIAKMTQESRMAAIEQKKDATTKKAQEEVDKEKKSAIGFLKEAGYDPETGEDEISKLIPKSTSGRLESMGAETAAFFGASTEGRKALNTLAAKSNKMVMAMMGGKLGAGISNADREFIVGQLGEIANSNKPADERLAAWTAVKNRMIETGMVPKPESKEAKKTVKFGDL